MHVTESFSVHIEKDKDILHWLEMQDNKSDAIRQAIRAYISNHGITLMDIHEAIMDLKRRRFVVADDSEARQPDEPSDIAANLDGLGL